MNYFIFTKYDESTGKLIGLMINPDGLEHKQEKIVGHQIGQTGMLRIQWSYDGVWETVNFLQPHFSSFWNISKNFCSRKNS
jgi:hypothetical protein